MTKYLISAFITFNFTLVFSQSGGDNIYDFLNLTNSARAASLGGQQISIFDDDLNFVYYNPSLLNGSMSNQIVLNFIPYIDDIKYGYASYAHTYEKYGNFGAGIHYIDYGNFIAADEYGTKTGKFGGADYSVNLYYSKPILDSLFQVGGTLKFISSHLETYRSFGMAVDAGITYYSSDKFFAAALVMKNIGMQLSTYYEGADRENLPFEIQLGLSQKLRYAPFRISLLLQHLETGNLRYETEEDKKDKIDPITGLTKTENKFDNFTDNVMRHVILGLEFIPAKFLSIRLGYNYKRRQELKIIDKTGFTGFSWGVGLKIYKFHINYGRASYHLASASDNISVSVNLDDFSKQY
jgi:hypothetical protein